MSEPPATGIEGVRDLRGSFRFGDCNRSFRTHAKRPAGLNACSPCCLPRCMAHGKTRSEAIRQAEAAIRLWIKTAKEDGLEIPQPRGRLVYA